ncbi:hypothetical protein [Hoylesella buccalis]|uniref:hypothetical protein n=1 Tax=Hoylesella buccalis TaxID=28127 RepID=UPI003995BD97
MLLLITVSVMAQTGSVFEQYLANATAFVNLCCILRADVTTQRRTIAHALYWNPRLTTDENGCATVDYSNGRNATYMNVDIETLVDGKPAAVNTLSYPTRKR